MNKRELVRYIDNFLRTKEIKDVSLNGLVVDNEKSSVHKLAVAVDASLDAIEQAKDLGVDFMIVHHGFFWGRPIYIDLWLRKRLKALFDADIALYVAHLPLDVHPEVGNNYGALKLLGFKPEEPFGDYNGIKIGVKFSLPEELHDFGKLLQHIEKKLSRPKSVWKFGENTVNYGVYCSGGCLSILDQVKRAGMDLFISGETSHAYYKNAMDMEMNVVLLGHYASETVGVRMLAEHIKEKFGISYVFVGEDTGL